MGAQCCRQECLGGDRVTVVKECPGGDQVTVHKEHLGLETEAEGDADSLRSEAAPGGEEDKPKEPPVLNPDAQDGATVTEGLAQPSDGVVFVNPLTVKLEKLPGQLLGLDLDIQDGATAYVTGINAGLVQAYNDSADAAKQVRPSDVIVSVNGSEENSRAIMAMLQKDGPLELVVKHTEEIECSVQKGDDPDKPSGLCFANNPVGQALVIIKIGHGSVEEWNARKTGNELKAGDRIVAVCGQRGPARALKRMIEEHGVSQVTVVRPLS